MKRKICAFVMATIICISSLPVYAAEENSEVNPEINESSAAVQDLDTLLSDEMAGNTEDNFANEAEVQDIQIPDMALKKAILDECDLNGDEVISYEEINGMTNLNIDSQDMADGQQELDLMGIENAVNLEKFSICMDNLTSGVKPHLVNTESIGELVNLQELQITNCKIGNLEWLQNLSELCRIELSSDGLKVFPELNGLVNLEQIVLCDNDITDLSNLSKDSLGTNFIDNGSIDLTGNVNVKMEKAAEALLNVHDIVMDINEKVDIRDFFEYTDKVIMDKEFPEYEYELGQQDVIDIDNLNHTITAKEIGETIVNIKCGDISESFSVTVSGDEIEIPDDYLRDELLNICDANCDGVISKKEIESYEGVVSVPYDKTHTLDLTGLEYATNLSGFFYNAEDDTRIEMRNCDILGKLKNLQRLSLRNIQLDNISFLENLYEIVELDLSNVGISNLLAVGGLKKLEKLTLDNNVIRDISSLKGLDKLHTVSIANNKIEDITPIVDLNLVNIDLTNNNISSIPNWTNYRVLNSLILNGNPLKDICNLKDIVNYGGNSNSNGVWVYAENTGLKQEDVFDCLYNVQDTNVYKGNFIQLENYIPVYLSEDKTIDLTLNSEGLRQIEDNLFQGIDTGVYNVEVRCGQAIKEFKVNVLEAEKPVDVTVKDTPVLDIVNSDVCSSMDTDKTLWSINDGKYEKVAEQVENYFSYERYSKNKSESWADYLVLDNNHILWNCQKENYDSDYKNIKIAENIAEYNEYFYLTKNNELFKLDNKNLVAENVVSYYLSFDWDGLCKVQYVFTTDGKVVDILDDKVIASNIKGECVLQENNYVILESNKAVWYDYFGKEVGRIDGVLSVEYNYINMIDGTQCEYTIYEDKIDYSQRSDNLPRLPIKQSISDYEAGIEYYLDGNNALWTVIEKEQKEYEIMAENVDGLCHIWEGKGADIIQKQCYIKDRSVIELKTDKKLLTGIKKILFNSYSYFYLSEEGKVYDNTNIGYVSCILSDVEDFVTQSRGSYWNQGTVYMTRKDGSIWQYNYNLGDGKAVMIKSGRTMGDLDGDGKIKIKDMMIVLHCLSGNMAFTEELRLVGDLDKDGQVTIKDMLRMLHYISGSSSTL